MAVAEITANDAKKIVRSVLSTHNVSYDRISARTHNVMGRRWAEVKVWSPGPDPAFGEAKRALKPYAASLAVVAPGVVQN